MFLTETVNSVIIFTVSLEQYSDHTNWIQGGGGGL